MSINKVILLGHTGKDPEVRDAAGIESAFRRYIGRQHVLPLNNIN